MQSRRSIAVNRMIAYGFANTIGGCICGPPKPLRPRMRRVDPMARAAVEPPWLFAVNDADPASGGHIMKTLLAAFTVAALAVAASAPADAKGCIKGAVVGGVAGHYAGHHGVLGAAAGCLYGRHRANEQDRQQQTQQPQGNPRDSQGKI
jgi:hypothetical protein